MRLGNKKFQTRGELFKFSLKKDLIVIWLLDLKNGHYFYSQLSSLLTDREKERIASLVSLPGKMSFIFCRGILKILLANYLKCSVDSIDLRINQKGKPFLKDNELEFNLSHSRSFALFAFSLNKRLGVDIEDINQRQNLSFILEYVGNKKKGLNPDPKSFYQEWTKKEAFAKACGKGLANLPSSILNLLSRPKIKTIEFEKTKWYLEELFCTKNLCASLCFESPPAQLLFGYLDFSKIKSLLNNL